MQTLHFFDCNASFGMRKLVLPHSFYKKEDLLRYMDAYGIEKALVSHALARELDPIEGNRILGEEIANEPALSPTWVVMPHHTREFPSPSDLIAGMKEQGVRAVTMYPSIGGYYYSLSEWNCGELYSALEEHGIPLFLAMSEFDPNFEAVYNILSKHPKMKMVLINLTYRSSRNLYPLLKLFPGLYAETSGFKGQDAIQDVCEVFGAERLLFGSNMPIGCGASAVSMITYANISAADKQRIASENLNELLGGVSL